MQDLQKVFWFLGNASDVSLYLVNDGSLLKVEVICDLLRDATELDDLTITGFRTTLLDIFSLEKHLEVVTKLSESIKYNDSLSSIKLGKIIENHIDRRSLPWN